jgi:penicillin-binding protein activator
MKHKCRLLGAFLVACTGVFMSGCASTVRYGDATSVQALSTDFSSTDLQTISAKMVDSMLSFPPIIEATSQRRPVLVVGSIKNRTTRWIDGKAITDTITSKLILSGKFRFVDRSTDREVIDELKTQQEGGLTNPNKAKQFGQQEAAEYIITGDFIDISQEARGKRDVYYKFTLSLRNLQTGIVEWKDEKEIRKLVD